MARRNPTELRETDDPYKAHKRVFEHGRFYPDRRPHDHKAPERAPERKSPVPDWDSYRASFADVKNSPMAGPAVDESAPQFAVEKSEHLNDCRNTWVRGHGNAPHFDSNVDSEGRTISGARYSGIRHRR